MRVGFSGDPSLPKGTSGGDPSQYGNGLEYNGSSIDVSYSGIMDNVPPASVSNRQANTLANRVANRSSP
jgi:hypothetical protein